MAGTAETVTDVPGDSLKFAFFGLGVQEIVLLGVLMIAVPLTIIFLVSRSAGGTSRRTTELEEENCRLRSEHDRRDARD